MPSVAAVAPMALGHPPGPVAAMAAMALMALGRGGLGGDHPRGEQHRRHDERRRQFDPSCHSVELLPFCGPFADPLTEGAGACAFERRPSPPPVPCRGGLLFIVVTRDRGR